MLIPVLRPWAAAVGALVRGSINGVDHGDGAVEDRIGRNAGMLGPQEVVVEGL
jgi:hypothetical protein